MENKRNYKDLFDLIDSSIQKLNTEREYLNEHINAQNSNNDISNDLNEMNELNNKTSNLHDLKEKIDTLKDVDIESRYEEFSNLSNEDIIVLEKLSKEKIDDLFVELDLQHEFLEEENKLSAADIDPTSFNKSIDEINKKIEDINSEISNLNNLNNEFETTKELKMIEEYTLNESERASALQDEIARNSVENNELTDSINTLINQKHYPDFVDQQTGLRADDIEFQKMVEHVGGIWDKTKIYNDKDFLENLTISEFNTVTNLANEKINNIPHLKSLILENKTKEKELDFLKSVSSDSKEIDSQLIGLIQSNEQLKKSIDNAIFLSKKLTPEYERRLKASPKLKFNENEVLNSLDNMIKNFNNKDSDVNLNNDYMFKTLNRDKELMERAMLFYQQKNISDLLHQSKAQSNNINSLIDRGIDQQGLKNIQSDLTDNIKSLNNQYKNIENNLGVNKNNLVNEINHKVTNQFKKDHQINETDLTLVKPAQSKSNQRSLENNELSL